MEKINQFINGFYRFGTSFETWQRTMDLGPEDDNTYYELMLNEFFWGLLGADNERAMIALVKVKYLQCMYQLELFVANLERLINE